MRIMGILLSLPVMGVLMGAGSAQEKVKLPKGPAPRFFTVTEIGKDNIKFTEIAIKEGRQVIFDYVPTVMDTKIYDASGKKVTAEDCRKRVKLGTVVLVAADQKMPDPAYVSVLKEDAIIVVPNGVLADGQPIKPQR
jgi:hypothetical protein